jgi:hypothetical protein
MSSLLKYLLFVIPLGFFWLSLINKQKLKKLKSTGRVPDMEAANRNASLFMAAAIITSAAIIYLMIL